MNELPSPTFYFEDLKVGDTFESTAHYHLTAEQITSFANEFDPQPFHLDDAAARKTFFAGLAASGWHTAAITHAIACHRWTQPGRRHAWHGWRHRMERADQAGGHLERSQ